jgi:hypothetical protein
MLFVVSSPLTADLLVFVRIILAARLESAEVSKALQHS